MGALLAAAPGLVALLLAAKSHGRQLRLERERAGYSSVVFGGSNPPFVVALWRADRVRFWSSAPAVALALGGGTYLVSGAGAAAVAAFLWAPVVAFGVCGALSWRRTRRAFVPDPDAERASIGWWSLTAAALALSIALATV